MAIRDIGLPLRPASRRVLNFHRKYSVLVLGEAMKRREFIAAVGGAALTRPSESVRPPIIN